MFVPPVSRVSASSPVRASPLQSLRLQARCFVYNTQLIVNSSPKNPESHTCSMRVQRTMSAYCALHLSLDQHSGTKVQMRTSKQNV